MQAGRSDLRLHHVIWPPPGTSLTTASAGFCQGYPDSWQGLEASFREISRTTFSKSRENVPGLTGCHNYGMVEQPGSIYMQCERGFMHCSNFSEIFVRRPDDLSIADVGEAGIIQTISTLPKSYPGHNLLTEDMGVLRGEDNCACGRKGKYFEVLGRLPSSEPKGCGDTYFPGR